MIPDKHKNTVCILDQLTYCMRIFLSLALLSVLFSPLNATAQLGNNEKNKALAKIIIKGGNKQQENNIKAYIGDIDIAKIHHRRWQQHFKKDIDSAMQALGYFHSTNTLRAHNNTLHIELNPGLPTRIAQSNIRIVGAGAKETKLLKLVKPVKLEPQAIINSQYYEALKRQLVTVALELGYLDAQLSLHRITIDREKKTASIWITLDTGSLYHMGKFDFTTTPIDASLISKYVNWRPGDRFNQQHIIELQKYLLDSRYFSSVRIEQRINKSTQRVDIHAHLIMRKRNAIDLGIGFATDTGPRTNITWSKPWLNSHGHSAQIKGSLSAIAYNTNFSYRIPAKSKRDRYWQSDLYIGKQRLEDTDSTQENIGLAYITPLGSGWQGSISSRYAFEQYEQADESGRSELLLFGISASKTKSKGGLIPTEGTRYSASIESANDKLLSDASFLRMISNAKWLKSFDRHRFFNEIQVGAIYFYQSTSLSDIPSSLRFFAGGDNSVRGYDYKSISPTNASGELIGGKYLTVTRTEYSYRFRPSWRAALFLDSGKVFNKLSNSNNASALGPGLGIHWLSPIGAIRFDLGLGIQNDNAIRLHISLGPEL